MLRPIRAFVLAVALVSSPVALAGPPGWDEAMFDDPATAPAGPEPAKKKPLDDEASVPPSRIIGSRPVGKPFAWRKPSARLVPPKPKSRPKPKTKTKPKPKPKPAKPRPAAKTSRPGQRPPVKKTRTREERPFDAMAWLEDTLEREEARDLAPLPRYRPRPRAKPERLLTFVAPAEEAPVTPPATSPAGEPLMGVAAIGGPSSTLQEALARVRAARTRQLPGVSPLQDPPAGADHHEDPASTEPLPVAWR